MVGRSVRGAGFGTTERRTRTGVGESEFCFFISGHDDSLGIEVAGDARGRRLRIGDLLCKGSIGSCVDEVDISPASSVMAWCTDALLDMG